MLINNLKEFAEKRNIYLKSQEEIAKEAIDKIEDEYKYNKQFKTAKNLFSHLYPS